MTTVGPDLIIAGAARSGTSTLAAALREHPAIDPGLTKEPNYFSRHYDRGVQWYDGLYAPRADGIVRMDASTSYTYPQFPLALDRLAQAAPSAHVVYVVREPIARAVSHYLLRRFTLQIEEAPTFGAALQASPYYTEVSDYRHWISRLLERYPPARLQVVPFPALTASSYDVATIICARLGLEAPPSAIETVTAHRNTVVEFRGTGARRAVRTLRRSPVYPWLRSALGATRVRQIRSQIVKPAMLPTVDEALDSCSSAQRQQLIAFRAETEKWVSRHLAAQRAASGEAWSDYWPNS